MVNAPTVRTCPLCGSPTTEGYLLDLQYLGREATRWVKGPAGATSSEAASRYDGPMYRVRADRCDGCGHLDLFAVARDYGP